MIKNIPTKVLVFGISLKKNHPLNEAHNNIVYSNGDITAGEAILYAVNIERKEPAATTPRIIMYGIENSKLANHFLKIN